MDSENDVIQGLFERPFSQRSIDEKLTLTKMSIPRPKMDCLKQIITRKDKTVTRTFNESAYDTKWLCGSENLGKLYCWPCLLFQGIAEKNIWCRMGYNDLNHLSSAIKSHAASRDHIDNSIAYRTFGKTRIDEALDHGREVRRKAHNVAVKKNREGMKTLIDIVCYLGSHGLSFRGHDESKSSSNRGNYKDLCVFLGSRDSAFEEFISSSSVFSGTSAGIQNELIEIIGKLIVKQITTEVSEAKYIAVMVDETTDISRKSQLATALRYCLEDGKFSFYITLS